MVCGVCQSTNVVGVKGVNYCFNCGNEVKSAPKPAKPKLTSKPAAVAAKVSVKPPVKPKARLEVTPASRPKLGEIELSSMRQAAGQALRIPLRHHLHWTGVTADLLLGVFILFPALLLPTFQIPLTSLRQEPLLLSVTVVWAFLGVNLLFIRLWSGASLTYGLSKNLDHRPTKVANWHKSGFSSLGTMVGLRVLQLAVWLGLAGLAAGLLVLCGIFLPPGIRLPVAFVCMVGVLGLASAVGLIGALARPAIVTEGQGLRPAIAFAVTAFRHKNRILLAGGIYSLAAGMVLVLGLGMVLRGLNLAVATGFWRLPGWAVLPALGASLVVVTLLIHFVLLFNHSLWLLAHHKLSRT